MGENQSAVGSTALNGEKHAVLADVANKIQALDNSVKLEILSLLVESGSLSITDIAKKLNINFSTAHKYLEQLEAASLVASKQVADNRLKRIFTIKDFNIELSPKALFKRSTEANNREKAKFRILDNTGQLVDFDEEAFSQKYIKRGMPRSTILLALQEILLQAYDGITLHELRHMFATAIENKCANIKQVLEQIEDDVIHKKTFRHILAINHPDALKQHAEGDIFIRNLRGPIMMKFSHDIRSIYLHGGIDGKRAKNLGELLDQILAVIDAVHDYARTSHILDSFNYLVAPAIGKIFTAENKMQLRKFLSALESKNLRFYVGLDIGLPIWTKKLAPYYYLTDEERKFSYSDYFEIAGKVVGECLAFLAENKPKKVLPVLKIYDKKFDMSKVQDLQVCFIANMMPSWQGLAASYSFGTRFDTRWKGWLRTVRVGEAQNVTLNLPRLASKSKTEAEFFQKLEGQLNEVFAYFMDMAELVTGEFLKYKTNFKSSVKERWDCAHIEDSTYYVSISGLDETIYLLSGKRLPENQKLAEKILKTCQKIISAYDKMPLRIEFKEEPDENIVNRFYALDKKNGIKVDGYSRGISCKDYLVSASLQQYLLGGHCTVLPKKDFDFEAFLKVKGGLAKLT